MAKPKDSDIQSREVHALGSGPVGQEGATDHQQEAKEQGAPAIIKERMTSRPPVVPESGDVEYLSMDERVIMDQVHTLTTVRIEEPDAGAEHPGPWIDRCIGRNPETGKMRVVRVPAREVKIKPTQVLQYLGSVVEDRQSVHTATTVVEKRRWGYVFDRFFYHNGKKLARCCYVPDLIHQASILYEKAVDKKTHKAYALIRRLRAPNGQRTDNPAYKLIGGQEADYRDLKRIYERNFLDRGNEALATDIGLGILIGGSANG